ncbi:hypothetical protein D9M71_453530 [compost metagenome]
MKAAVVDQVRLYITPLQGRLHLRGTVAQLRQVRVAQARHRFLHRQAFQRLAHLQDLQEALAGHFRHPQRTLRLPFQRPLGHQPLQGGAHRHRAGAPLLGQVADLQAFAGAEAPAQQGLAKLQVKLLLQVVGHRSGLRWRRQLGESQATVGHLRTFVITKNR